MGVSDTAAIAGWPQAMTMSRRLIRFSFVLNHIAVTIQSKNDHCHHRLYGIATAKDSGCDHGWPALIDTSSTLLLIIYSYYLKSIFK